MIKTEIVANGYGVCTPKYLVVHTTANVGATAREHLEYWGSGEAKYYAHYVSDWTAAYHAVRDNRLCWHVGNANSFTIGIEICESAKADQQKKGIEIAAQACAEILKEKGWGIDKLITHDYCTKTWGGSDHTDPLPYFKKCGITWSQFKNKVAGYLDGGEGWQKDSKGWWYRRADGSYPKNEFEKIDGKWYHFNGSGYMQTGWVKSNGYWYYFASDGHMLTGWQKISGHWYYLRPGDSGRMVTGWLQDGGAWYYLQADGVMFANGFKSIGGKWYGFARSGKMLENGAALKFAANGSITLP